MEKKKICLPKNRFELFKEIIRNQFSLLLKLGLLTFIILLPIIITFLLVNVKIYELNLLRLENQITDSEQISQTLGYVNGRNLLFVILIPLAFYFLSGIFNVIRKVVWCEGVIFWHDYKKGLKDNGSYFVIIGLLLGVLFFVFSYSLRQEMINHSTLNFISTVLSGIGLLVLILFMPFLLHQTIIYNLKFLYKVKNTLIIFSKLFYIFIILALINIAPFILLFVNNGALLLVLIILLSIVVIPLLIVINTLFTDATFDAFINHLYFKEIYRKGLYNYAEDSDK